jgi:hypothetical protein
MIKNGIYQHYKKEYYEVIAVARHSETLEELVVYRCLYGAFDFFVRPLAMFQEDVEIGGLKIARFTWVSDEPAVEFLQHVAL